MHLTLRQTLMVMVVRKSRTRSRTRTKTSRCCYRFPKDALEFSFALPIC